MSLNFAAFAKWMHSPERWFERVLGKLITVANPFFQIESLYRFNAKFFPRWEPRYLVYDGPLGLPRASLAALWVEGQLPKPEVRRTSVVAGTRLVARAR
jgi:lysyl-tRNA synthetase class 2